jgi:hypothetical protein
MVDANLIYKTLGQCQICQKTGNLRNSYICEDCNNTKKISFQTFCKNQVKFTPDISQITDKVYLGDFDGARVKDELKQYGITHILICAEYCYPAFPGEFEYMHLNILDHDEENIYLHFNQVIDYIDSASKVYVHCQLGVSRSASFVIAYLMKTMNMGYTDSYNFVKKKRRGILPNNGFLKQLKLFEKDILVNII